MKYLPGKKGAALLGIHQNTLRKYADRGIIPSFKTASGQRRYDVDAYLNQPAEIETVCLVKGGDKVYHCGGEKVSHWHNEKANEEPCGDTSGAVVGSSGVN